MKLINPRPKRVQDTYRDRRVKHLLNQIVLHAEAATLSRTAIQRDTKLNMILACIREIHLAAKLNEHKRTQLARALQVSSLCNPDDIYVEQNKISISAPIDIDVDQLANHVFW